MASISLTSPNGTIQRAQDVQAPPRPKSAQFEAFVREHKPALLAKALSLCGNQSDAGDLVQDTLERAWRAFPQFKPGTNPRAWFFTILKHLSIDRFRANARGLRSTEELEGDAAAALRAPEPEESPAWAEITSEQMNEAIEKLGEEFRIVYRLHAVEGRSYSEIAQALGIAKMTVGTRLIRARRRLKELLMPKRDEEGK